MANEVKKANREAIRKAIQARKEARKTETAAKYEKMRACAKAPAKFAGVLNVLVAKSARQADYMDGLRENLGLVKAAAEAPAKVRVAAARNYGKDFIKIAEEQPDMLADALREAYKGLDEQAAAMEVAAEALGIDLGATPTEKAFADEGKKELGEGESKGEESEEIPDFESKEEPAEKKEEKPAEEKEPEEEKEAASGSDAFVTDRGNDGKPEAPKEAAVGQDAFVSDRDGSGQPKAPQKAEVPQAQGKAAATKTAMSKKDYVLIADAIKSSQLSDLDKEAFARHISQSLRGDNSAFMEERFVDYTMGRGGPSGGRVKEAPKPRAKKEKGTTWNATPVMAPLDQDATPKQVK
jgi:hypothetical protein